MKLNSSHLVLYERQLGTDQEWECKLPGWSFLHVHHGDGLLLEPNPPRILEEGNTMSQGPGQSCVVRASHISQLQLHYFFVQPELLTGILSPIECQQLQDRQTTRPVRVFSAQHDLSELFRTLARHAQTNKQLEARCAMLNLASQVLREALPPAPNQQASQLTAEERLETFIREIPAAELQNLSVTEAARRCGCSVRHFSRLFKARCGVTLLAKQIDLRLQRAQQLLLETDAKIITIAMDSGFQHLGLFTAMFKRRFGMTPSAWRRRRKASPRK